MPDAQLNNIRLHYEVHGEGEPLVLIPGFGTGLWIWFKQTPVFTRHFKVILFDPRGVASSEHRDEAISIRTIADDVAELMRFLGIERAHILGASFGGFVAQEFALAYPEMTASLILCCTSFGGPNHVPPSLETLQALASTKGLNTAERVRENLLLAFSQEFVQENRDDIEKVIALRAANYVPEYVYLNQLQAAYAFAGAVRRPRHHRPSTEFD
jgi:pimeloyl-ACP methyl ester carboxylesterase